MITPTVSVALLTVLAIGASATAAAPTTVPALLKDNPTDYAAAAAEVTQQLQRDFYLPKSGLYAQSLKKRDTDFMWGNGITFTALVAAARHQPAVYRTPMARFFRATDRYWDTKAPVPGYEPSPTAGNGHDKYYDDNAWMVLAFLEAYDQTKEARYLVRARQTLAFVLSGEDDTLGGGIWWHETHKDDSKNTCVTAPASVACLKLAAVTPDKKKAAELVATARRLVDWTTKTLQQDDGLFADKITATTGKVEATKWTYNTALMLRANLELYRQTGEADFLKRAERIGQAADAFMDPKKNAYRDGFKFTHLLVEADLDLYRETGDNALLARAVANADYAYTTWKTKPPADTIEVASIARMLWLVADAQHPPAAGKVN